MATAQVGGEFVAYAATWGGALADDCDDGSPPDAETDVNAPSPKVLGEGAFFLHLQQFRVGLSLAEHQTSVQPALSGE